MSSFIPDEEKVTYCPFSEHIELKVFDEGFRKWGNCFLTESWELTLHFAANQHDYAMERLNIDRHSILASGRVTFANPAVVVWRASTILDRSQCFHPNYFRMLESCEEIVKNYFVEHPELLEESEE